MRFNKTDPLRFLAYKWETELFNWAGPTASPRKIRQTIERACRMYRVPPPTVAIVTKDKRDGKKLTSHSIYENGVGTILIRPRHRFVTDAIHEAAHWICDHLITHKQADHSPEWLSIHLNLLARFKILPMNVLRFSAKERGLRWVPLLRTTPTMIRRNYPRKPNAKS